MKNLFLTFFCLMSFNLTSGQITASDSVAGVTNKEITEGSHWLSYSLSPNEANQEFVLKESLNSKPSCYGYIYINEDRRSGAVCYIPKNLWQDKDLQMTYLDNDANWIDIVLVQKKNPEFLGKTYDRLYVESNADYSQFFGYWYFDKIVTDDFIVYHGNWTNGKTFEDGFKTYYIQFL